jgi:Flp pilus assembly pilin Flp
MRNLLKRLWIEEQAENMPEYALLLFLIAFTAVSAMTGVATKVNNICSSASTHLAVARNKPSMPSGAFSITAGEPINWQSKTQVDKDLKPAS